MNYFEFDNLCFNNPYSEQIIVLMISAKSEHKDFKEFINCAVERWYEKGFYNIGTTLSELKAKITNTPISDEDKQFMFRIIEYMNERVHIELEEIENIVVVLENGINEFFVAFETKYCRYYFYWITTA